MHRAGDFVVPPGHAKSVAWVVMANLEGNDFRVLGRVANGRHGFGGLRGGP